MVDGLAGQGERTPICTHRRVGCQGYGVQVNAVPVVHRYGGGAALGKGCAAASELVVAVVVSQWNTALVIGQW